MRDDCSYLHSLEQEVAALRAQVAALSSDSIGQIKRGIAASASRAITAFRPDLMIDPALQHEGERDHWDSGFRLPPTPHGDSPRSPRPHPAGQPSGVLATSLTRMVHDAALRTGHAQNITNPLGSVTGSEISNDSPAADSPQDTSRKLQSPFTTGAKKRRTFAVPPLPPQPAVERLVAAYVDFVGVTAPIIHIPSLGKQLVKIRENRDVEQSDIFVVMMVLGKST